MTFATRLRLPLLTIVMAATLATCGNGEAEQRRSFIAFLQDQVLAQQGVRLPQPSEEQRTAFGPYADHYAIITGFHGRMDSLMGGPMQELARKSRPGSLQDILDRKDDFTQMRQSVTDLLTALDGAQADADAAHAVLTQPDDLAPVYAAAYDKLVTVPARTVKETFPELDHALVALGDLATLMDQNRDHMEISGDMIQTADADLLTRIQAAIDALNVRLNAVQQAQGRLQNVMYGR